MANAAGDNTLTSDVAAMRRFNRFFTRQIGVLEPRHLNTSFSLPEARVIYELSQCDRATPGQLAKALGIDAGQLSRLLQGLQQRDVISRQAAPHDKRQFEIALTTQGRTAFDELSRRSDRHIGEHLRALDPAVRARVIGAMKRIERELAGDDSQRSAVVLRAHRPGDIGWIIARHGALYAQDYGWDISFEQLVAEIAAQFLKTQDERRERCWIAELDGEPVGSVMLVKGSDAVAKLRLLIVEPSARGLGIGHALTAECIRFARSAGYDSITLWTQSILLAARNIYRRAGFRLVNEQPHHSFGHDLIGETWELLL